MDEAAGTCTIAAAAVDWHAIAASDVAHALHTDTALGLEAAEADARLQRDGHNVLPGAPVVRAWQVALRQLRSPLVYVLLAAAAGSIALGRYSDAGFIGFVLLVNSSLGTWQEWNAERHSAGLRNLLQTRATVVRGGRVTRIEAAQLVRGDLVLLESGQCVPADLRLLESRGFEVDEALLTGESMPVTKDAAWIGDRTTPLGDRCNSAFAGTTVARGRARGLVVTAGTATELGRLARAMAATRGGKAPLIARMEHFSRAIAIGVLVAAVVIAAIAILLHGHPVCSMFTFGVALAVSAIPEGLPVAVTVSLAIAARRMASRGVIVRQLPAVEGLGSCTLIASDKTGTLTCNELTVRELELADGSRWRVDGAGYAPVGAIVAVAGAPSEASRELLAEAVRIAAACNEAELVLVDGHLRTRGDPTDLALLALAGKAGIVREMLLLERPPFHERPFEPEQRYAATFHRSAAGTWVAVKGAPERVLEMCAMAPGVHERFLDAAQHMAASGLRVLALASATTTAPVPRDATPDLPASLELRALVGVMDPLREGAAAAVRRCAEAGVRVLMVTGDHPLTALAIARELGIARDREEVVTGADLSAGNRAHLAASIAQARVFARVTPEQKLAIVEAAQAAGHFVAVTGDGVNDAPALRQANIGIAMGRGGTDVARAASDLVLSDDNFATIVAGVEEGRVAYQNIRNVVYLLTAAGIAEVLTLGTAIIAGLPLPLLPVQLLWLNLVTNGIQDVGLAFERGRGDELQRPPRPPGEAIFDRLMLRRGLLAGLWMSGLGLGTFVVMLESGATVEHARNVLLLLMVLMQNVDAINARSEHVPVARLHWRSNPLLLGGVALALVLHVVALQWPWMQRLLSIESPTAFEWVVLPLLAASLMGAMELQKAAHLRHAVA